MSEGYKTWVCPNGHTASYPEEPYNPCIECGADDWSLEPIEWVREQIEHSPLRYGAEILDHIDQLERWVSEGELEYGEVPLDNFRPDPETPLELGAWDLGVMLGYHLRDMEGGE